MTDKIIYRVAVDCNDVTFGPCKHRRLVVASGPHEALDLVLEDENTNRLWDEEIQRNMADGKEYHHKDYDGLLEEADYVGEL